MPRHLNSDDSVSYRDDDKTLANLFTSKNARNETRRHCRFRGIIATLISLALLAGVSWGILALGKKLKPKYLIPEQCIATSNGHTVTLSHEQMHFAALITGIATREGVGERGAAIALATALQESSLHNLDYGDLDSVGLFQQRPSQGWGTREEIMDPDYSTVTFLTAMQKIDWEVGSINNIAQKVQRSGVPDGYLKREPDALALAAVFSGTAGSTVTCLDRERWPANSGAFVSDLNSVWGINAKATGATVDLAGASPDIARAWGNTAVANMRAYGIISVQVGDQLWQASDKNAADWIVAPTPLEAQRVHIEFRT
ncbi:MAG: hypothetical protein ACRDAX_03370 [Propionibacteriaceae bacterium]